MCFPEHRLGDGLDFLGTQTKTLGVGPARLGMGNVSGFKYGQAKGRMLGVSAVAQIHEIGVDENATPEGLARVIDSLPAI